MTFVRWHWPGLVAVVALALTWAGARWFSANETAPIGRPSALVPMQLGAWTGESLQFPPGQVEMLRATDLLLRSYRAVGSESSRNALGTQDSGERVLLFVAYYRSQRTGATLHSPKNCLPGSGWQFVEIKRTTLPGPYARPAEINETVIQNGAAKQLLFYWYQGRGRVLASEYAAKFYLIWDAVTEHRSDGALVRVSVPVAGNVGEARTRALDFIRNTWPPLTLALEGRVGPEPRRVGLQ
jgi:EpsI family protein